MLLPNWSFLSTPPPIFPGTLLLSRSQNPIIISESAHRRKRRKAASSSFSAFVCLRVGMDAIAEIAHNKVLIAAAVSAAVGQVAKPFTTTILYGGTFDFKAAFQAGGFPSTHSSAAVATATSLGLERGFSDAIFGLAVVYASLTIYDAQGVRREVGTHAKTLNRILFRSELNSLSSCDAESQVVPSLDSSSNLEPLNPLILEEPQSFGPGLVKNSVLQRSNERINECTSIPLLVSLAADLDGESEVSAHNCGPLKESVGHTEIEVIAGAMLGFLVSLALYSV